MPTYSIGGNKIVYNTTSDSSQLTQIRLKYGGTWVFDLCEIVQLAEILTAIQHSAFPVRVNIWRTNGSLIEVFYGGLGYIVLEANGKQGRFLKSEVSDFVDALREIITPVDKSYSFNENRIRLYKKGNTIRLYALILRSTILGPGIWIFNESEIQQLKDKLRSSPFDNVIVRSNQSRVTITKRVYIELKEGNHQSKFSGSQLRDSITYMQNL